MRLVLCVVVYMCVSISLFVMLLHLMTLVDPGLKNLGNKPSEYEQLELCFIMSKGFAFVVIYSIFLLVLFCVMCYLMSTINPPPLDIVEQHKANSSRKFLDLNMKSLIVDHLATGDNVEYGLDKVPEDEILTSNSYPLYLYTPARIEGFNGPDIETVQPPVWPPQTKSYLPVIVIEDNDTSRLKFDTRSIKTYRRSVNNGVEDNEGAIIFKILHGNGRPRIEIKLGDIEKSKRNTSHLKYNIPDPSGNDRGMEKLKLNDNNVIKMVLKDSIVIYDDESPKESNKKDYERDLNTLNKNKNISNHNMKNLIIDNKIEVHSIASPKPQMYAVNGTLSNFSKVNVHNVTNGTRR